MVNFIRKYGDLCFLAALTAVVCVCIGTATHGYIADDAYFYLVIADNVVQGHGATFNEIFSTNGFHPLWLIALLPVAAVTDGTTNYLTGVVAAHGLLAVVATVGLAKVAAVATGRWTRILAAGPPLFLLGVTGVVGSEAALSAVCLVAALWVALRGSEYTTPVGTSLLQGLVLGAAILARLDNFFFVLPLLYWIANTYSWKRALQTALAAGVVVSPYLAWNIVEFSHLLPISAAIKSTFPHLRPNPGSISPFLRLCLLGWTIAILPIAKTPRPNVLQQLAWVTGLGAWLHAIYISCFVAHSRWHWYAVMAAIACGLAVAAAADSLRQKFVEAEPSTWSLRTFVTGPAVAVGFIAVLGIGLWWRDLAPHADRREALDRLRSQIPSDAVVATTDFPGRLAFYSEARVIPLDGFANNFDFHDQLLEYGLEDCLRRWKADYFVWNASAETTLDCLKPDGEHCKVWRVTLASTLYERPVGAIEFSANQSFFEFAPGNIHDDTIAFRLAKPKN